MRTRWMLWDWYSFCSRHRRFDSGCSACQMGTWVFRPAAAFSRWFYRRWPDVWRWWANRPSSKTRRMLERWFPELRRTK